jgi:hypothetical protein
MASTIKLNNDHKALLSVINYDRKCDATIWSITDVLIVQATGFSFGTHSQWGFQSMVRHGEALWLISGSGRKKMKKVTSCVCIDNTSFIITRSVVSMRLSL